MRTYQPALEPLRHPIHARHLRIFRPAGEIFVEIPVSPIWESFVGIPFLCQAHSTARDLQADRANVMHAAAKLRPVVIDESLTDIESLMLAREMGYSGAALKACKGQSQVLLMAAAAQKHKMFLCVQDLTCPGASLIHSAGLAAHVPGVAAIEANARQYVPAANKPWEDKFPGIFKVRDGMMDTSALDRPGLGAV